jgi:hypothetical protein
MSSAAPTQRQAPIAAWVSQMIGTVVLAVVVFAFVKSAGAPLATAAYDFQRYMMGAILVAALPAILYLRVFKENLLAEDAAIKALGRPDPAIRKALMRSIAIGGGLCELPMALGVVHLFFGGEVRWFAYATLITLATRLSYRPFIRLPGIKGKSRP